MSESNNLFKKNIERAGGLVDNIRESVKKNPTEFENKNDSDNTIDLSENEDIVIGNGFEGTTQDLLKEILKSDKKNKTFPHTIYLTEETGRALTKCAKKANKSKSVFLEELLSRILLNR